MSSGSTIAELLFQWEQLRSQGVAVDISQLCRTNPALENDVRRRINRIMILDRLIDQSRMKRGWLPDLPEYEIISELGSGGMGIVYQCRDRHLQRLVALKVPRNPIWHDARNRERFMQEARTLAQLRHPNIVPIHEFRMVGEQPLFVMDFIAGGSLGEHNCRFRDPIIAAALIAQIARGVHYAHSRGIIHRDLKHSNVFLDEHDRPMIGDFGIAKEFRQGGSDSLSSTVSNLNSLQPTTAEATGIAIGTPGYMAPEQLLGSRDLVGCGSDIWAIGVILYELITARMPFSGITRTELAQRIQTDMPLPPSRFNPKVPKQLDGIIAKCLAKLPQQRFATADELATALENWTGQQRPGVVRQSFHRHRFVSIAALSFLVLLLVFVSLYFIGRSKQLARTERLVATFLSAPADRIRSSMDGMQTGPTAALRYLKQSYNVAPIGSPLRFRAALGILALSGETLVEIFEYSLRASPEDLAIICRIASDRLMDKSDILKSVVASEREPGSKRLRAACLLAQIEPDADALAGNITEVITLLLNEPRSSVNEWARLLTSQEQRFDSFLKDAFKKSDRNAAIVLAEFHRSDVPLLVGLMAHAKTDQLAPLIACVSSDSEAWRSELHSACAKAKQDLENALDEKGDGSAATVANLVIACIKAGIVLPFDSLPTNEFRPIAFVTSRLPRSGLSINDLFGHMTRETTPWIKQAILLGISEQSVEIFIGEARNERVSSLLRMYQTEANAGVHSAIDRLLRIGGISTDGLPTPNGPTSTGGWYVTKSGITMSLFDDFAISVKEVTVDHYRRFRPGHQPGQSDVNCPVEMVSATECEKFCNFLSEKEQLGPEQWCYEEVIRNNRQRLMLKPNFKSLKGYRLPFETEWECAAQYRSGAKQFLARNEELLPKYAWFRENGRNRVWPVGLLFPNSYGMFDTIGNVSEWCADLTRDPEFNDDQQSFRGVSTDLSIADIRLSTRGSASSAHKAGHLGFRIVRSR